MSIVRPPSLIKSEWKRHTSKNWRACLMRVPRCSSQRLQLHAVLRLGSPIHVVDATLSLPCGSMPDAPPPRTTITDSPLAARSSHRHFFPARTSTVAKAAPILFFILNSGTPKVNASCQKCFYLPDISTVEPRADDDGIGETNLCRHACRLALGAPSAGHLLTTIAHRFAMLPFDGN